ncbi:MAG: hypothetical protein JNM72_13585 [Deltaproteobacteria bacterium]|nr:hypothetical protein [Deltaproteobacteria bacterium]
MLGLFALAFGLRLALAEGGARHAALDAAELLALCGPAPSGPARRVFDGHEGAAARALVGCGLDDAGPAFWPGQRALWAGIGALARGLTPGSGPPSALWGLLVPLLAGAASAPALAWAAGRRWGAGAGLRAGALLAVLPAHALWSTSPAPVVVPLLLLLLALGAQGNPMRVILALVAASQRAELGLAAALLLGAPGLPAAALGAALLAAGAPAWGGPPARAVAANLLALPTLAPVSGLLLLALGGAVGGRGAAGWAHRGLLLVALPLPFYDLGVRHLLLPLALACGLGGRLRLSLALALGLAWALALPGLAARWLADPPAPPPQSLPLRPPAACIEISDEPPIPGQPRPSWAAVWPGGCAALDPAPPCLVWAEGPEHSRWQSRGLDERAARMRALFALEPVALDRGGPGPWRRWHRLSSARGPLPGCALP